MSAARVTRVAISGAGGRMGAHLLRGVDTAPDLKLTGALEAAGHPRLGEAIAPGVTLTDDPAAALAEADVAVDFSVPEATLQLTRAANERGTALVVGTTGFAAAGRAELEGAAGKLPIVLAPNFSLGIHVLVQLVSEAARQLESYELEVLELHHSRKVDAPSGTALRLARAAADARGLDLEAHAVYHREGHTGTRPADAIGMQSRRAGDAVGEHTVYLAGPGERLELTHRALSRDNFAAGALRAARWLIGRAPGLYTMTDVMST